MSNVEVFVSRHDENADAARPEMKRLRGSPRVIRYLRARMFSAATIEAIFCKVSREYTALNHTAWRINDAVAKGE